MVEISASPTKSRKKIFIQVYLALILVGAILTIVAILRIPGEAESAIFLGQSTPRLILTSLLLAATGIGTGLLLKTIINPVWHDQLTETVVSTLDKEPYKKGILIVGLMGILGGLNFILQIPEIREPVAKAYYIRLEPLVLWSISLCLLTLILLFLLRYGLKPSFLWRWIRRRPSFPIILGLMILVWAWVSATGFGLRPIDDSLSWHPLGVPILETQVLTAWGISLGLLLLLPSLKNRRGNSNNWQNGKWNLVICTLLWITAFSLWMSEPLKPNWFSAEPRPPNHEFYPNSDASVYDITAQNLMLGAGFKTRGSPFTLRPFYALFLVGLHWLGGLAYEPIIWMQVAVLAFIPIFLYKTASLIHGRFSGLIAALLLISREINAIRLGDSISEAHVKLLMPFMPTAFGLLLFTWIFIKWLQSPDRKRTLPIIAGGIMGIFMLIRPEIGVILPFVGLAALLHLRKQKQVWFWGMVMVVAGTVLAITPWVWRNYQLTGTIFIDSPHYRLDLLTKRYREDPVGFSYPNSIPLHTPSATSQTPEKSSGQVETIPTTPAMETKAPSADPIPTESATLQATAPASTTPAEGGIQDSTSEMADQVIAFIQTNMNTTGTFILNHFMNNLVQTVLALPSSHPFTRSTINYLGHRSLQSFWLDCCSLVDYERRTPFWPKWDGRLPRSAIMPVSVNIIILAAGISTSWRRGKFAGLIPIFGAIGYYLIHAVARNSGGRYIVPYNWVGIFYFSIGLGQISHWAVSKLRDRSDPFSFASHSFPRSDPQPKYRNKLILIGIGGIILLIGGILPILENCIPVKFDQKTLDTKLESFFQVEGNDISSREMDSLRTFTAQGGLILQGRALYPRHHKPYQMGSVWRIYQDRPYSHLDFYLSSPVDAGIILPMADPPGYFPHGVDVIIFACEEVEVYDALAVGLFSEEGNLVNVIWRPQIPEVLSCPMPPVDN